MLLPKFGYPREAFRALLHSQLEEVESAVSTSYKGFSEMLLPLLVVNTLATTLLALLMWSFHFAIANS